MNKKDLKQKDWFDPEVQVYLSKKVRNDLFSSKRGYVYGESFKIGDKEYHIVKNLSDKKKNNHFLGYFGHRLKQETYEIEESIDLFGIEGDLHDEDGSNSGKNNNSELAEEYLFLKTKPGSKKVESYYSKEGKLTRLENYFIPEARSKKELDRVQTQKKAYISFRSYVVLVLISALFGIVGGLITSFITRNKVKTTTESILLIAIGTISSISWFIIGTI